MIIFICTCAVRRRLHLKHSFQPDSELPSRPRKSRPPEGDSYSASAVFSPCLLDARSWLRWPFRGVWVNETARSHRSCWYSCLPRGSTTAPEERGQRNGLGPWHWPSSLFTSPQTEGVAALTAELRVQSQSCWLYPTGLYSDYLPAARAPVWSDAAPERLPGTDSDAWRNRITWDVKTFCIAPTEHTLHHNNYVETEE